MAERKEITQALCEHVRILLAGGATAEKAAEIADIGKATVYRIKRAGFDAEGYRKLRNAESEKEKKQPEPEQAPAEERHEVPGQICMDLTPRSEMSDQTKMMRFMAGQIDKLYMKLETINDTLNQILRVMRKE